MTNRAGLPRPAAATNRDIEVELVRGLNHFQRLPHDHARGLAPEVLVERVFVDDDPALAGAHENTGGGRFASPGPVILSFRHVT